MNEENDLLSRLERHANLGHAMRNAAFLRQVRMALKTPGATSAKAAGKAADKAPLADAASMYRFVDNDQATLADLRTARAKTVLDLAPAGSHLLLLHDMSPLDYSRHNSKKDRRKIGNHRGKGYEYVCCLALDLHSEAVLGVVHDTVINADGPDDRDAMDYDYEPLFADFSKKEKKRLAENHRHQMAVHVNGTAPLLSNYRVTDVGDREFDDLFILDRCRQEGRDFVIRSSANRNVQMPPYDWLPQSALTKKQAGRPLAPGYVYASLPAAVASAPLRFYKELPLDAQNRVVDPQNAKRFAKLYVGSFAVRLFAFIAKNGGWLGRRRDPIGPQILMRGLLDVLAILDASLLYKSLIEEALDNPEIIREIFCV